VIVLKNKKGDKYGKVSGLRRFEKLNYLLNHAMWINQAHFHYRLLTILLWESWINIVKGTVSEVVDYQIVFSRHLNVSRSEETEKINLSYVS